MKSYLCKYIPPRRDFLDTLSTEEQALMADHVDFLNELLAQKIIVAHGPVLDDKGAYGVSLFRIDDSDEIEAYTARDPIAAAGVGHYEHHPMLHLTT